jgi:hypothetical protein
VEFLQRLAVLATLSDSVSNSPILSLSARSRHCGLALGGPRNYVVVEEMQKPKVEHREYEHLTQSASKYVVRD